ncbi:MAG: RNA polymerase sigma factor [Candidatus Delongbacteria bacterium]|nr:RNA polymerase sigma factor [Candidatus Delongbacteria bacterium]MBN2836495.1 RNA polymerase sigma factor [Candidatus Delongbacteria bacterium]
MAFFSNSLKDHPDSFLIEKYKSTGKEKYLREIMERYGQVLYSYIRKMSGMHSSVEDIYQNVWLKIVKSIERYDEQDKFKNYLFFIATNSCYDYLRTLKRENENRFNPIITEDDDDFLENIPDYSNPIDLYEKNELKKKIYELLDELPLPQREVFLLRSEGFSFKEISEMKNVPVNSLLSRMRYATIKLRKGIENEL